jgi:hypothetical protein
LNKLSPFFKKYSLEPNEFINESIQATIGSDYRHIKPVSGYCDCNSGLGCFLTKNKTVVINNEDFIKLGVSQEYLDELKQETLIEEENKKRDAEKWINFLTEFLESGETSKIGILLHDYHGDMEIERLKIIGNKHIKVKDIDLNFLMDMQYDIIYYFES